MHLLFYCFKGVKTVYMGFHFLNCILPRKPQDVAFSHNRSRSKTINQ